MSDNTITQRHYNDVMTTLYSRYYISHYDFFFFFFLLFEKLSLSLNNFLIIKILILLLSIFF